MLWSLKSIVRYTASAWHENLVFIRDAEINKRKGAGHPCLRRRVRGAAAVGLKAAVQLTWP